MAERKTKRNTRSLRARKGFQISGKPIVRLVADDRLENVVDSAGLPRVYGPPIVFAIARDSRTVFVSWNIDWLSVFEKAMPVDRQVHLRVYRADGLEEKSAAVEPMAGIHYVTTSEPHGFYHVEIGYYQPADIWHSVAMSNEVVMPPDGIAETTEVDLATIPFHVSFQQLLNMFGPATETELAAVISQFEKRALSSEEKTLSGGDEKILRKLHGSVSVMAAAWRAFNAIDDEKLASRTRALLGFGSSSPFRGFGESSWS
ncbi:MAG: hypothetical protein DMF28_08135 [Verrucomicrobia bacterium]|nr:MAG: hypothetical protein DMF28_08135 [Verrucomicrobiota bacterium]